MAKRLHWTEESLDDFRFKVAFDFVAQIELAMRDQGMKQSDLAAVLGVTPGRVSQVFNNPANLNLRSMVEWTRKLGHKMAVVLYDDGDEGNRFGPIDSEVFRLCWEKVGRPHDVGETAEFVVVRKVLEPESVEYSDDSKVIPIKPWLDVRLPGTKEAMNQQCYALAGGAG